MRRGLYRIRGVGGRPDDVRVEDDGIEMPVEEALYRGHGYQPAVDDLPWQEEYFARRQPSHSSAGDRDFAEKAAREQARQEFRTRFRKP